MTITLRLPYGSPSILPVRRRLDDKPAEATKISDSAFQSAKSERMSGSQRGKRSHF